MSNSYFKFKQFTINQGNTAMKVGVDSVLLGAWIDATYSKNILDIGTGTGIISLMLAQKSNAFITAIEVDQNAFNQANENISSSKWSARIKIENCSLQDFVTFNEVKFDLIVCNPPYFTKSKSPIDERRNLARHDNSLPINDLLEAVSKLIVKDSRFIMIYPFEKKAILFNQAEKEMLFPHKLLEIKGTEMKSPNRIIVEFINRKVEIKQYELTVRNSGINDYTPEYKELTKDYYLAF